ncbi:hypothetical protein FGO68_gene14598 [Halteria grandinella]|uniref:SGNH hydrolase-type esterase domain-containing protein n=1 Tax=Halteria grandinella TaxID=5974 RepID=A0A8J8SYK3_HALGN|nr:hypothetical protein FGO68_gene14598 [Halteria grandinella]
MRLKFSKAAIAEARRVIDPELGWKPTPSLVREGIALDALRRPTQFRMTQNADGFRLASDTATTKPRVFVLGDSYTQADDIDDSKFYPTLLADRIPEASFWAFGCSGYGTFQQWMILEKHVGTIRPSLLLLQMSSNDVVNNLLELEDAMPFLATPGPRPYLLDDGTTKFHFSTRDKGMRRYSRAWGSLLDRFDSIVHKAENWIPGQVRQYGQNRNPDNFEELLDTATRKTAELLNRMKATIGPDARLIAFYDEDVPPLSDAVKKACELAGVELIDTIGPAMMAEEGRQKQFVYRTIDKWHWNDAGHAVVAEILESPVRSALGFESSGSKPRDAAKIAREPKPGGTAR